MRLKFIFVFCVFTLLLKAQPVNPFDYVGRPGAMVYTDLKEALKEPAEVSKLDLTGQIIEPKKLLKASKLVYVEGLKLGNNQFTEFPAPFLNYASLVYFSSQGNAFTDLPASLDTMQRLRYVFLSGTKFDTLPVCLTHIRGIETLSIRDNADTMQLTADVSWLSRMRNLSLVNAPLDSLPESVKGWKELQSLEMTNCNLHDLPPAIGNLSQLTSLSLDNNKLKTLPRQISKLKNLYSLSLRNNQLSQLPDQICFLRNLAVLDLRGNPFSKYDVECLKILLPGCKIYYDEP